MDDLVSIIIPTYKRSRMLKRAISSALYQSYNPIEVIVVDDNGVGSSDSAHVSEIVSCLRDPRVRLICNEVNLGGAEARNVGICAAKGSYVAFLDDDDEYEPDKLALSMARFESEHRENLAIVYGFATSVYEDGSTFLNDGDCEGWCPEKLLETRCLAATSQWVCLKNALKAVGGFVDAPAKQDSILMLKLFKAGYEVACVRASLSLYHEHSQGRISGSKKTIEGERILQELGRTFYDHFSQEEIDQIEFYYETRMAILYFSSGGYAKSLKYLCSAWKRRGPRALGHAALPLLRLARAKVNDFAIGRK